MDPNRLEFVLRSVNEAIGRDAFVRYSALPIDILQDFESLLRAGQVDSHRDGFCGFTSPYEADGNVWTNEGFAL